MLKLVKECAPGLDWKVAGIAALVAVGVAVCLGAPAIGFLAGAAPLLLIVACLVPCLAPLVLLRRKGRNAAPVTSATIPLSAQQGQASGTCGCGQASCSVGGENTCGSEAARA